MFNLYMVYFATNTCSECRLFIESLDSLESVQDRFALNGWERAEIVERDESGQAIRVQSESDGVSRLIAVME